MYIPAKVFSETTFGEDTYITEYFPVSGRTQHGVMIPVYKNGQVPTVFADVPKTYTFVNGSFAQGPNCERLLTREEYEADLNGLVEYMTAKHNNRIRFVIKNIDDMYSTYLALHPVMYVSGLISICKLSLVAEVTDKTVIPPEGLNTCLGFETYVASLKRNLPMLVIDYFTASNMYKLYLDARKFGPEYVREEIPLFLNAPNLDELSKLVYSLAPDLTVETIRDVVINETQSDAILSNYYLLAQQKCGLRERLAKAALVYHPTIVNMTIQGAWRQLGIESNRATVWRKSKISPQEQLLMSAQSASIM